MFFKVAFKNEIHVLSAQKNVNFKKLTEFIASAFKKVPKKYQITYKDSDGDTICLFNDMDLKILLESGVTKVRLQIQETNQDFYDVTQEIQFSNHEEPNKKEETEVSIVKEEPINTSSIFSNAQSLDSSISEKLTQMISGMTKQIKEEILSENKIVQKTEMKKEEQNIEVDPETVHKYYICDECGCDPIIGIRYKCAVCADFDLCEKCQVTSTHEHPFLKIKNVRQAPMKLITILDSEEESLELNGEKVALNGISNCLNAFGKLYQEAGGRCPRNAASQCPFIAKKQECGKCPYMAKCEEKPEGQHPKVGPLNEVGLKFKEAGGKCPYMAKCEEKPEGQHPKVGPLNEVGLKFKEAGGKCPYMAKCEEKPEGQHPKVGPLNEVGLKFKEAGGKCPYMAKYEQKVEEKKDQVKAEEKSEEKVEQDQPVIEEEEPILIIPKREIQSPEENLIEKANYLAEMVDIDFNPAIIYVKNFFNLSKEDIVMKYLGQE